VHRRQLVVLNLGQVVALRERLHPLEVTLAKELFRDQFIVFELVIPVQIG
jgi:hypothetical protein